MRAFHYSLFHPFSLAPTEEVDVCRVVDLEAKILRRGRWTSPIMAHEEGRFVMDGHHRLAVAKRLQIKILPVVFLDYRDVDVTAWREGEKVTPEDIVAMARSGRLFPCKTTRHIFKVPIPSCDIPLARLGYALKARGPTSQHQLLSSAVYGRQKNFKNDGAFM